MVSVDSMCEFEENQTQREDIHLFVVVALVALFGGEIQRSSAPVRKCIRRVHFEYSAFFPCQLHVFFNRKSEVSKFHNYFALRFIVYKYILRLQVSVYDVQVMDMFKPFQYLLKDHHILLPVYPLPLSNKLLQSVSFTKLHLYEQVDF